MKNLFNPLESSRQEVIKDIKKELERIDLPVITENDGFAVIDIPNEHNSEIDNKYIGINKHGELIFQPDLGENMEIPIEYEEVLLMDLISILKNLQTIK